CALPIFKPVSNTVLMSNSVTELLGPPSDGVLVDVVGDGLLSGGLQVGRGGEVREALSQVDGPLLQGQTRHLTDDRLSEVSGALRAHNGRQLLCKTHRCRRTSTARRPIIIRRTRVPLPGAPARKATAKLRSNPRSSNPDARNRRKFPRRLCPRPYSI